MEKCNTCRGTGVQVRVQQLGPGFMQQMQSECSDCQGEGEKISAKDRCKECQGKKIVKEKKTLEVHVDKGLFNPFVTRFFALFLIRHFC